MTRTSTNAALLGSLALCSHALPEVLARRAGDNDNINDGTNTNAIIGYAIGGTACVLVLFIVAYTWFRARHRQREAVRLRAQDRPAVRAAKMTVYAREQERRLRAGNARRWAGSAGGTPLRSPGGGAASDVDTPPPSYFDGAGTRLPRYPSDRTLRK